MKVIVDTSVWSQVLRRRRVNGMIPMKVEDLILDPDHEISMLGCIRQELLSGLRSNNQFCELRTQLREFPDEVLFSTDYESAAEFSNRCRQKGIQGSSTDFLICAVAVNRRFPIFTLDNDFKLFQPVVGIDLFQ
jgi:predicted nucleic acid-binding protein